MSWLLKHIVMTNQPFCWLLACMPRKAQTECDMHDKAISEQIPDLTFTSKNNLASALHLYHLWRDETAKGPVIGPMQSSSLSFITNLAHAPQAEH
jgi:hypothetical protein